jgi:hypothetical protein
MGSDIIFIVLNSMIQTICCGIIERYKSIYDKSFFNKIYALSFKLLCIFVYLIFILAYCYNVSSKHVALILQSFLTLILVIDIFRFIISKKTNKK